MRGKSHPLALREQVLRDLQAGASFGTIAARYGLGRGTVGDWSRRWRKTGTVAAAPYRGGKRPLLAAHMDTLQALVQADPTAQTHVILTRLLAAGAPAVSIPTVKRAMRRLGFQRSRLALEKEGPRQKPRTSAFRRKPPVPGIRDDARLSYPSDLTEDEWALIAPLIPPPKPGGRPQSIERRELLDAMLYVLRTGCQWRALPHDFPHWKTVYTVFRLWRNEGVFERINATLRRRLRREEGRDEVASAWVLDSQSAKTTEKGGSADSTAASASLDARGKSSLIPSAY